MARNPSATDWIRPATNWFSITPSNSTDLAVQPRAIHCGGTAGTIAAHDEDGTECSFYIAQGGVLSIAPKRILSTGTTATGLVGIY